jgi:hypothetical protein
MNEIDIVREIKGVVPNVHLDGLYKDENAEVFFVTFENSNDIVRVLNSPITNSPTGRLECKKADDLGRDTRMRVELRHVPLEISEQAVKQALGRWFSVAEVRRLTFPKEKGDELRGLQDGRRLAFISEVLGALPAAVRIFERTYKVHFYAPPERQFCWQCWRQGHTKEECHNAPACRYCRSEDHGTRECPQNPGAIARRYREEGATPVDDAPTIDRAATEPTVDRVATEHTVNRAATEEAGEPDATLPKALTTPETEAAAAEVERRLVAMRPVTSAPSTPKGRHYNLDVNEALRKLEAMNGAILPAPGTAGPLYSEKAASPPPQKSPKPQTFGKMTVLGKKSPPKVLPKNQRAPKPKRQPTPIPPLSTKNTPEIIKSKTPNQGSDKRKKTPPKDDRKKPPIMSSNKFASLSKIHQYQC